MSLQVVKAEWVRLTTRGMLAGGGVLVILGALATLIVFTQAVDGEPGGPGVPVSRFEGANGFARSLQFTGTLVGGVALVLFARTVTNEYQYSTLKVKLVLEPRRLVLLGGKFVAMAGFFGVALVVAYVAMLVTASVVALVRGIENGDWWTIEGLSETALGFVRLLASSLVWGLFGFALGTVLRSGGAAIGVGLGALLIGGHIGERFWEDSGKWLPDALLAAFTVGGTEAVSLLSASLVVAAYAAVLATVSAYGFSRGDVLV